MPRGLVAWELYLLLAGFPADQEVTADGRAILGADLSFGQAELVCAESNDERAATVAVKHVRELIQDFELKYFAPEADGPPLAPLPIINDMRQLIEKLFEAIPDEE